MYVDLTAIVSQALSNITASSVVLTSFKLRLVKLTAILTQESSRKQYLPQRVQRCFLKCSYWSFADLPRGWNLARFLQFTCMPSKFIIWPHHDAPHMISCTRFSHFSQSNIEKLDGTWGRGYMYLLHYIHWQLPVQHVSIEMCVSVHRPN